MSKAPDDPLAVSLSVLKGRIDVSKVFILYVNSNGDRFKTAIAAGLSVDEVDLLVTSEKWDGKLNLRRKAVADSESQSDEDLTREIARMRVAALGERLLQELDTVMTELEKMTVAEKMAYLFETDRTGKKTPTAKFWLEIAKTLETASGVVYRGTRDQLPMRPDAPDSDAVGKRIAESAGMVGLFKFFKGPAAGEGEKPAGPLEL